jgi:uracil-DNA glycosylase family 4
MAAYVYSEDQMTEICRKLDSIYLDIDNCTSNNCALARLCCNKPPRLRYSRGKSRVLIVGQNPGRRVVPDCDHVWGGLDLLKRYANHVQEKAVTRILEMAWITNLVKCRTENNKPPTREQIENCLQKDWLKREIEAIKPERIICLGKLANTRLGPTFHGAEVVHCRHPSYIARFRRKDLPSYIEELRASIC